MISRLSYVKKAEMIESYYWDLFGCFESNPWLDFSVKKNDIKRTKYNILRNLSDVPQMKNIHENDRNSEHKVCVGINYLLDNKHKIFVGSSDPDDYLVLRILKTY